MRIDTPSRIHIALIDLNGSYGRVDGGIGLTIEKPGYSMTLAESDRNSIEFAEKNLPQAVVDEYTLKINRAADRVRAELGIEDPFAFTVNKTYPSHSGLGSGTQIALATAKLMTEHAGIHLPSVDLAKIVGRAGTSGIGAHGFDLGGFIVDGGHSKKQKKDFMPSSASEPIPPVLIGRYDFPEEWGIALVRPKIGTYVCGREEINIFQTCCPLPKDEVKLLSHIIFMNLVPFLIEHDLEGFSACINRIQEIAFNKCEFQLQPPEVTQTMNLMKEAGIPGVGLSSLGPTLFGVYDIHDTTAVKEMHDILGDSADILLTKGQNHGAVLYP